MEQSQQKLLEFSAKINSKILELIYEEESENHIDLIGKENEFVTEFIHALATVVPSMIFNRFTDNKFNHLEFNHLANTLCFQFMKGKEDTSGG